jgi:hypothetical protein
MQHASYNSQRVQVADLVLVLVDGHFGFEMETFELLNVLQVVALRWRADCVLMRCDAHNSRR